MLILVKTVGVLIALTPEPLLRRLCFVLGRITYWTQPTRRVMAERNLHHGFPEKDAEWRRAIIKENCSRLVETALFVLASPFFSEKRAKAILGEPAQDVRDVFRNTVEGQPCVLLLPHFTLSEAVVTIPLHFPEAKGKVATIFRPLDHQKINEWVVYSRSRFGVELLSRKEGYSKALEYLDHGKSVGILFDQNASGRGSLIHFMERIASATELPGMFALRKRARAYILYPERTGFWRARIRAERLDHGSHPIHLTIAAHDWLAKYLASSDDHCADWLWLHDKWGSHRNSKRRFRHYRGKRNRLALEAVYRGREEYRRVTTVWFRLPDNVAEFRDLPEIMARIRHARPDYAFCLISTFPDTQINNIFGDMADRVESLRQGNEYSVQPVIDISKTYPDVWIDLNGTPTSQQEMRLSKAEQRYSFRPLKGLKHAATHYGPPPTPDSWIPFFQHFGLNPDNSQGLGSEAANVAHQETNAPEAEK